MDPLHSRRRPPFHDHEANPRPITLAFRRVLALDRAAEVIVGGMVKTSVNANGAWDVIVGDVVMLVFDPNGDGLMCEATRDFAPEVTAWIQRYDEGRDVNPTALVLKDGRYEIEEVA